MENQQAPPAAVGAPNPPAAPAQQQRAPPVCYRCQNVGHIAKACPNNRQRVPRALAPVGATGPTPWDSGKPLERDHAGMPDDGKPHWHWHRCESCDGHFRHKHVKPEAGAKEEKLVCKQCTSKPTPEDAYCRLRAYLEGRVSFLHKNNQLAAAMMSVGLNWCRDNNITDELEQGQLLARVVPEVMSLTPAEGVIRRLAEDRKWRKDLATSNLIAQGTIPYKSWGTGTISVLAGAAAIAAMLVFLGYNICWGTTYWTRVGNWSCDYTVQPPRCGAPHELDLTVYFHALLLTMASYVAGTVGLFVLRAQDLLPTRTVGFKKP